MLRNHPSRAAHIISQFLNVFVKQRPSECPGITKDVIDRFYQDMVVIRDNGEVATLMTIWNTISPLCQKLNIYFHPNWKMLLRNCFDFLFAICGTEPRWQPVCTALKTAFEDRLQRSDSFRMYQNEYLYRALNYLYGMIYASTIFLTGEQLAGSKQQINIALRLAKDCDSSVTALIYDHISAARYQNPG